MIIFGITKKIKPAQSYLENYLGNLSATQVARRASLLLMVTAVLFFVVFYR